MTNDNSTAPFRFCKFCSRDLPLTSEHFHKDKSNSLGFAHYCKECNKQRAREWEIANPERAKANKLKHQINNREQIKAAKKAKRDANVEVFRERDREYAATHRQEARDRARKHYYDNHDAKLDYARSYYNTIKLTRRNELNAYSRAWRKAHPEVVRAQVLRYRARKRNAPGTYTADDLKLQYKAQKGLCWWCSKPLSKSYHADHVIALSKGGSNDPRNIVLACGPCNQSKSDKLPQEWNGRLF